MTYVAWPGVNEVGDRTYFYRRGLGWVDSGVPDVTNLDLEIERWSPAFFELLTHGGAEQSAGLAHAGPVVMQMGPTVVRFVDGR